MKLNNDSFFYLAVGALVAVYFYYSLKYQREASEAMVDEYRLFITRQETK